MAAQPKIPGIKDSNTARLNKLALPNCHLVEAVLKEHYHVFNDDCRDRLKKLLEVILTVNGGTKKFDKFDENFKRRCIKNLRRRLENLEAAHRKNEDRNRGQNSLSLRNQCGDHNSGEMQVLFKASKTKDIEDITDCGDHSDNDKDSYKTAKDTKPHEEEKPLAIKEISLETTIQEQKILALKQLQELDDIFAEYKINLGEALKESISILHESKSKVVKRRSKSRLIANIMKKEESDDKGEGDRSKIKKKVAFKDPLVVDEECGIFMGMGDVPTLAVRYYVALISDMERNSKLYEEFLKIAIQPTETYKQPYMNAAYNCWMEYFNYNRHTLDYLHPYIKDLVRMCKEYGPGHPKMAQYETKLPVVLINSVKSLKPWRRALQETIECCAHLTKKDKKHEVSWNVHQLYVRHYKKIEALKTQVK